MSLFIHLVLSASASLRCASQALGLFLSYVPPSLSLSAPSWGCGRFWVLRLGYYKLMRPKDIADDWVWIVDHSTQLDTLKCLVILGVRLSCLPVPLRSLRYEDMEPIEVLPVKKSNGEIVYQQLEESMKKTGIPRQIVADHGSDVKKGIDLFCQTHPETVFTYDIKHKTASVLKHELEQDEDWKTFSRLAAHTKQQVQQTSLSFLSPRNQRTKARYMNADRLIEWGLKALHVLAEYDASPVNKEGNHNHDHDHDKNNDVEWERVMEKIGWVREFRDQLHEWGDLMNIVETTEHVVRTEGLACRSADTLKTCLSDTGHTVRTKNIREAFVDFVAQESSHANPGEILVGSSEVLESLFGKFKDLEGEQSKSGFTGLLLSIPAMVSTTTGDIIHKAMETVPTKKVLAWCKKYIGKSLQAKRKEAFSVKGKKEQKWDQLLGTG